MFGAKNKRNSKKNNFHFVLICDENGILDAFKFIKDHLGTRGNIFLSLIYTLPKNCPNPLFERELNILEKRYSCHLFTYILKIEQGELGYLQEFIEAIINSNTFLRMRFSVFGNELLVKYVYEVLEYLSVDSNSIELRIS